MTPPLRPANGQEFPFGHLEWHLHSIQACGINDTNIYAMKGSEALLNSESYAH